MANHKSAEKAHRQSLTRAVRNKARLSRVKTFVKKVDEAIDTKSQTAADTALRVAEKELMRGAQKGIIHKNAAARKISRLVSRIRKAFAA